MSPYTPQTWADHDVTKPVSAARMTVIENGLSTAQGLAETVQSNVAVIQQAPLNVAQYSNDVAATLALAQTATRGRVYVPSGVYDLSAPLAYASKNDIELFGDGPNATRIRVTGNFNAISVTGTCSRLTFRDLWLGSDAARASGIGLSIIGSSPPCSGFLIENVTIQNMPQLLYCESLQQSHIKRLTLIQSIAGAVVGVGAHFLKGVSLRMHDWMGFVTAGTTIGSDWLRLDSSCDTVMATNFELLGAGGFGVNMLNSLGGSETGPRLVRLKDIYCESGASSGFKLTAGRDIRMRGCHAAVNTGHGFHIATGPVSTRLADCISLQNNLHGYFVEGNTGDVALIGCDASNNSQGTTNTSDGLRIEDSSQHVRVIGGRYADYVFGTGGNRQRYNISVGSTSTDYIVISGCDVNPAGSTGGIGNFSGGTHNAIGTGGNVS